jgi:F0F1-type ATP synthase membrane subunit b/b'
MKIDELLNKLDDMVDSAWGLPLSGGRCVLDADKVRDIIDDLRLNLPKEIPQAKAIVADRTEIIKNAKEEAGEIIKKAEDKARLLVTEDEIVKQAQEKANTILKDALQKSKEMKKAAVEFSDHLLSQSEETVVAVVNDLRQARQALRTPNKTEQ